MISSNRTWRCTVCGYIHHGDEPPDSCPVCGAAKSEFEPYTATTPATTPPTTGTAPSDKPTRVLIVGAGIAGLSAAESVRQASPSAEITLISKENHLPYYRLNLTRYLDGEIHEDQLPVHPATWYPEQKIHVLRDAEVAELIPSEKAVLLRSGDKLPFDKLILTTGAHGFVPPIAGSYRHGVMTIRSVDDVRTILGTIRPGMPIVCIGGGILGLEAAAGLVRRGASVTVLEAVDWLMPRQLNQPAGELLRNSVTKLGIQLLTRVQIKEIVGDERAAGVSLENGTVAAAHLVIVTAGVRPNSHLARRAGLQVNQGIVVNDQLITSHPDILAAGDVAEHRATLYGIWGPAQYQGAIAGLNAAGQKTDFGGIPRANTLKVLGINLYSIGKFQPDPGDSVIDAQDGENYAGFTFHDHRLIGAILLGDIVLAAKTKKAIETRADLAGLLAKKPGTKEVMERLAGL